MWYAAILFVFHLHHLLERSMLEQRSKLYDCHLEGNKKFGEGAKAKLIGHVSKQHKAATAGIFFCLTRAAHNTRFQSALWPLRSLRNLMVGKKIKPLHTINTKPKTRTNQTLKQHPNRIQGRSLHMRSEASRGHRVEAQWLQLVSNLKAVNH